MSSTSGSTTTGTARPSSAILAVARVRPKRLCTQRSSSIPASWSASPPASASPCAVRPTGTFGSPLTRRLTFSSDCPWRTRTKRRTRSAYGERAGHRHAALDHQRARRVRDGSLGRPAGVDEHEVAAAAGSDNLIEDSERSRAPAARDLDAEGDVVVSPEARTPRQLGGTREHVGVAPRRPEIANAVLSETDRDPDLDDPGE